MEQPARETGRVRRATWKSRALARLRRARGIVQDRQRAGVVAELVVRTDTGTWERVVHVVGEAAGRGQGRRTEPWARGGQQPGVRGVWFARHDAAEGEWEDPRAGWAEDRLRRFMQSQGDANAARRVRAALAQGVGAISQVLEGVAGGSRESHWPGVRFGVVLGACCLFAGERDAGRVWALLRVVTPSSRALQYMPSVLREPN